MGFRFWKRMQVLPGVTLNLSSSGPSVSVGPQGAKVTVGRSGAHVSLGLPGTGLFWTSKIGGGAAQATPSAKAAKAAKTVAPAGPAQLAWQEGLEALLQDRLSVAVDRLGTAWTRRSELPGGRATVEVAITPELTLALAPDARGAGLAYAEALQRTDRPDDASVVLRTLRAEADAPVVRVSLAELLLEQGDPAAVLEVCGRSRDPVVSLYRARALLALGRTGDALAEVQRIRAVAPPDLDDDLAELAAAASR